MGHCHRIELSRRALVLLAVILLLGTLPAAAKQSLTLDKLRHSVVEQRTRVVIDLSAKVAYKAYSVPSPDRIAINLPDTQLARGVRATDIPSGVVGRIRINRLSWGTQVVLDLRERVRWEDFYLAPVDGMPNRIVIDIERMPSKTTGNLTAAVSSLRPSVKKTVKKTKKPAAADQTYVVAIDAGHGGSDPGATRNGLVEKKEALDIAKRVARDINSRKGYKAVLIRDRDVFLSLPRRTEIAREKGADIFVSIHLNSAPKRSARGSEVFFLSPSGAEATAKKFLRNKKNAAEEFGLTGTKNDDLVHMIVDVNQQSMMQRSALLAEEILTSLNRRGLPPTRMIKQRSFAVLKSITMPSVMVETGFVTNGKDAAIFKKSGGKDKMSEAITAGVLSFLRKYPPPKGESRQLLVHRVRKGDTLWKISKKYNTSVASIQKTNRLGSSKTIKVGQELVIREGYGTY